METKAEQEGALNGYTNNLYKVDEISDTLKSKMAYNLKKFVNKINIGKMQGTYTGYYNAKLKKVYIRAFKDINLLRKSIIHELTHVASSEQVTNGEIIRTGFFDIKNNIGKGFNEAINEYYARKIYATYGNKDNLKMYGDLFPIAKDLVVLYGDEAILDSFVNGTDFLEQLMKKDGKDLNELKKLVDDFYKAVHEDKNSEYEYPLKKPEVSIQYEKIGNFIEDIKGNRGIIGIASEWKKVHKFLLDVKNVDDYTISEIYTNFHYFSNKLKKKGINITSCNADNFIAKLNLIRGIYDYKEILDKLPYTSGYSNEMINKILENVKSARTDTHIRESVLYDESKNEIVFNHSKVDDSLKLELMAKLTEIAIKKQISSDNLYRGIFNEKAKYVSNDVMNMMNNNSKKHVFSDIYSKLIELFGKRNMLELNEEGIDNIRLELTNAGVNDEFFEAFNLLYDSKNNFDIQRNAEMVINEAFMKVLKFRAQNEKTKEKLDYTYEVKEKSSLKKWIREKIINRIFRRDNILLLDEADIIEKKDFLSKYKVDTQQFDKDTFEMKRESQFSHESRER